MTTYQKYKARGYVRDKAKHNAQRRAKRLAARLKALEGKQCLNCEILLVARLEDGKRCYLYCRKCITEYSMEMQRHKWRRYYYRKTAVVRALRKANKARATL